MDKVTSVTQHVPKAIVKRHYLVEIMMGGLRSSDMKSRSIPDIAYACMMFVVTSLFPTLLTKFL